MGAAGIKTMYVAARHPVSGVMPVCGIQIRPEQAQELTKIAISSQDVANAVVYALNQPKKVTVNDLIVSPTRQNG